MVEDENGTVRTCGTRPGGGGGDGRAGRGWTDEEKK